MGLKNLFKRQLSIVIEWKNQSSEVLFYKYPAYTDEIKNASKLIVAPGQGCIIVYEGKIVDTMVEEGIYFLETDNHPFITNLLKFRQSFESEHKMHIYFFRTAEIVNQKWGTAAPVKYMDTVYKLPIELGAYGNFSLKLTDACAVFTNLIGSKEVFTTQELKKIIASRIAPALTSYLAQSGYSYKDIDARLSDISAHMQQTLSDVFSTVGLVLLDFRIEGTSFDANTMERINKVADMTSEALAATEIGLNYESLEKLRALRDAAKNEGGLAGVGLHMGAGLELGKTFVSQKEELTSVNNSMDDAVTQLKKLKLLLDEGILTQEEFDEKKKDILNRI